MYRHGISSGYIYNSIFQSKLVIDKVFDLSNECSHYPSITKINLPEDICFFLFISIISR